MGGASAPPTKPSELRAAPDIANHIAVETDIGTTNNAAAQNAGNTAPRYFLVMKSLTCGLVSAAASLSTRGSLRLSGRPTRKFTYGESEPSIVSASFHLCESPVRSRAVGIVRRHGRRRTARRLCAYAGSDSAATAERSCGPRVDADADAGAEAARMPARVEACPDRRSDRQRTMAAATIATFDLPRLAPRPIHRQACATTRPTHRSIDMTPRKANARTAIERPTQGAVSPDPRSIAAVPINRQGEYE